MPPPVASPPTPTCATLPPATFRPSGSSVEYTLPHVAPAPIETIPLSKLTSTWFSSRRSSTTPPATFAAPGTGRCPPERIAKRQAAASSAGPSTTPGDPAVVVRARTAVATSSADRGVTMHRGASCACCWAQYVDTEEV